MRKLTSGDEICDRLRFHSPGRMKIKQMLVDRDGVSQGYGYVLECGHVMPFAGIERRHCCACGETTIECPWCKPRLWEKEETTDGED